MLLVFLSFLEFRFLSCHGQCFFLVTDYPRLVEDKIGGVLGLGGSGKDGLAVVLEDLQPIVDVVRMAHILEWNTGMGAEEGGTDLGHQFLESIAEVTEAVAKGTV